MLQRHRIVSATGLAVVGTILGATLVAVFNPAIENNRRAEAFRKLVGTMPAAGTNTVIVSHKPNIMDAFGKDWFDVREGEASVFEPDGAGGIKPVVRIKAGEWSKL